MTQTKTLTGKVISADDSLPVSGATISVKGTSRSIAAGADGSFSLSITQQRTTLVVTSIGYLNNEFVVQPTQTNIIITLTKSAAKLDEVVVIGYGHQKKSDLTGAISSIKGGDITQLSTQRVDQALQGRAAGVFVLNTDGAPGGNTTIRVRGMNSINGGNNALIVIDGLQGGNLNSLNPNDIESIEVLKDASATAIYGSQGANGVILITTKLGKKGKPNVSYSYSYGIQQLRDKLGVMNAAEFAETANAYALTRNGSGATPVPIFSDAQIDYYKTHSTDWQDVIYRTAPIQDHELSISGGTDNVKYLISGGYLNQDGILVNSGYKRYSLRTNLKTDIASWVSAGLNWVGTKESGNSPPFGSADVSFLGNAVNVAPRWPATEPVYDSAGNYWVHPPGYGVPDTWNPLASAKEPLLDNNTNRNAINAYLEFKILSDFTLRITGGAIIENVNNRTYYNQKTYEGRQNTGLGIVDEETNSRYQNSNILTYDKIFKQHHLTVTAVAEQQYSKYNVSSVRASDFLVDQTGVFDLAGANIVNPSSFLTERVLNSYLGRINYVFADKYLLTASYRADGSSVFGANNKWGYFPSASVAWRASQEDFIKNLNIFSDLKLRASWGITGNQAISPYQTLSKISSGANYPYNGTETTDLGFYIANAANPSLKWETTTQIDFGIDFSLFNGRLNVSADYYKKKTEDLLMPRTLPGYTGFTSIIDNVGSVQNKGLEFEISGTPLTGIVRWNSAFNISGNRNKVLNLGDVDMLGYRTTKGGYSVNTPFMYLVVGEPFGQMYGYGYEGTWKTTEEKQAAAYGQLPGDPKYRDKNHDGKIDLEDFTVIGNAFPDFIFGWNNTFNYKNFELNFLIQGTKGNDLFDMNRIRLENPAEGTSTALLDRWTPEHQNTDVPAFIDQKTREEAGLTSTVAIGSDQRIQRWVEDASYVRLKNITLSYTVPRSIVSRIKLSNVRIYASGTNLITITKYKGYDPEVSSYNGNDAQIGVDFSNYPPCKIYTFGLNVSF